MQIVNLISTFWDIKDSYGRVTVELANTLKRLGVYVNAFGSNAPRSPIYPVLGGIYSAPAGHIPKLQSTLSQNGKQLAITMFESTRLPPRWTPILNKIDAVVVPARFLLDVFADNGVTAPLHYAPLGISRTFCTYVRRRVNPPVFTVLAIADGGRRKGWHLAGTAFVKAFGNSKHHRLILKTRLPNFPFSFTNENVEVIRADWSDRTLLALYSSADVMLFPSSGEGFGLPPREFAATGGLSIVTNWGGLADDVDQWGVPVDYQMVRAWQYDPTYDKLGGRWSEPLVDKLAEALTWAYENYEIVLEMSYDRAKFVWQTYTWERFAETVWSLWMQLNEPPKSSRIIEVKSLTNEGYVYA